MKAIVIGTGYVGLVQAACLAHLGHEVAAVDIDEQKINRLLAGEIPFFEPRLADFVQEGLENGLLTFHTSQQSAEQRMPNPDAIFCCVQTPRTENGTCDLSAVKAVAKESGSVFNDTIFVVKSTMPPGKREELRGWLGNQSLRIASNPEFLREGTSVRDFMKPERVLIGAEVDSDAQTIKKFYKTIDAPVFVTSVETAQLAKYASNTMLAMRLALMNEIANIADSVDADIKDIEAVIGSDTRIGSKFLRAGAGFGGSCFPKDVLALADVARQHDCDSLLIQPIIETNDRQPLKFVEKFGDVSGKKIAVWGLAFNKNTDDIRESPALKIVNELVRRGATVTVFDPKAMNNAKKELGDSVVYTDDMYDALNNVDMLAVLTEWPEFEKADWHRVKELLASASIFDGKNFLPREELESLGFEVHGMGLCARHKRRPQQS